MLIILFGGIIIFLSDKSRPNRVRTEGIGANWGMRCCDGAAPSGFVSPSGPALTALSSQQEFRLCSMKINHGILFLYSDFFHLKSSIITEIREEQLWFCSYGWIEMTMWQQQTKCKDLKSIQITVSRLFSSHFPLFSFQVQLNEQKILSKLLNCYQLPHRQAAHNFVLASRCDC